MLYYDKIDVSEGIDFLKKQVQQMSVMFVSINIS